MRNAHMLIMVVHKNPRKAAKEQDKGRRSSHRHLLMSLIFFIRISILQFLVL